MGHMLTLQAPSVGQPWLLQSRRTKRKLFRKSSLNYSPRQKDLDVFSHGSLNCKTWFDLQKDYEAGIWWYWEESLVQNTTGLAPKEHYSCQVRQIPEQSLRCNPQEAAWDPPSLRTKCANSAEVWKQSKAGCTGRWEREREKLKGLKTSSDLSQRKISAVTQQESVTPIPVILPFLCPSKFSQDNLVLCFSGSF